jgi:hypothetical protein
MKIIVFSDSHGKTAPMLEAVALETPGMILHLGDNERDCRDLEYEYPQIPLRTVRGNCDRVSAGLNIDEFTENGKRLLMTHGHLFGVKTGKNRIIDFANNKNADILLFGHTHIPHSSMNGKMAVICPGSIGDGTKSYAVVNITNGAVSFELKQL